MVKVDEFFDSIRATRTTEAALRYIEQYFADADIRGKAVIDAGCGTGADCRAFAVKGCGQVTGIDISPKSIEVARKEAEKSEIVNAHYLVSDINEYFRRPVKADIVFSQGALIYIPQGLKTLNRLAECVEEGGILFFTAAADSIIGRAMNVMRRLLSRLPKSIKEAIVPITCFTITVLRRVWGSGLKERGISLATGIKVNLFMPLATLMSKEDIYSVLERNHLEIDLWEPYCILKNDVFYLVRARKRTRSSSSS